MTYKITVWQNSCNRSWWNNTFNPIYFNGRGKGLREAADVWEKTYGYSVQRDAFGYASRVVFPNKSEAIMFILRWS